MQKNDDIMTKLQNKTITKQDWQQISDNKILQYSVINNVIKDCKDY